MPAARQLTMSQTQVSCLARAHCQPLGLFGGKVSADPCTGCSCAVGAWELNENSRRRLPLMLALHVRALCW